MDADERPETDATAPTEPATTQTAPDSGARSEPPRTFSGTWGDLKLIAEIGHGGFGRVYRAWDPDLKREVALKIVKLRDPTQRAAALKEGQMLARVTHTNVVTVFRAQQVGDEVGLTMELIKGRHLGDLVWHDGPMGAHEAAGIGIHICQALAAVHGQGLLHRDVKTRNVMRAEGGRIVLMDFGAGREGREGQRDGTPDLSGTPLYLAPELFGGHPASAQSDLYSLGVLLFYLVTRKYPVEGSTFQELLLAHSAGKRLRLADARPDLPPAFVQVVERALAARPEQRYRSAGEMMADLNASVPIVEGPTPITFPAPAPVPRSSLLVRTLVTVPIVILSIGLFGLLTSAQYNRSLGRDAGFSDDTPLDWWALGLRSLIPVFVYIVLILLVVRGVVAVWHLTQRMAPPAKRVTEVASKTLRRWRGPDRASAAQVYLVLQVLSLAAVIWGFNEIFNALLYPVNTAPAGTIAWLNPYSHQNLAFRVILTLLFAVTAVAWEGLLLRPVLPGAIPVATVAAGMALLLVVLLMLEVPYRILHKAQAPQVEYDGLRCFEVGARNNKTELLLFCPDAAPDRNRTVLANDPKLIPQGTGEIFAPPPTNSSPGK